MLWAVQNGYMDQVPVERVSEFQKALTDFLTSQKVKLLATIGREKALSQGLSAELKAVIDEFSKVWERTPVR